MTDGAKSRRLDLSELNRRLAGQRTNGQGYRARRGESGQTAEASTSRPPERERATVFVLRPQ